MVYLVVIAGIAGCTTSHFAQTTQYAESEFPLDAPNFEMDVVHAVGEASCFYVLFSIPLCEDQSIATIAWERMRREANMEGKSSQFVNIFEDRSLRWNFLYLFYLDNYMVSANVVVYKKIINISNPLKN